MTTVFFDHTPSVGDLFRELWRVLREWTTSRWHARMLKKIDFRELREDEITDEMRAEAEEVLRIPKKDLINIK